MEKLLDIVAVAVGYFLPAVSAYRRRHHNRQAILLLNLFGGWTVVGWIVAVVWSFTASPSEPTVRDAAGPSTPGPRSVA